MMYKFATLAEAEAYNTFVFDALKEIQDIKPPTTKWAHIVSASDGFFYVSAHPDFPSPTDTGVPPSINVFQ